MTSHRILSAGLLAAAALGLAAPAHAATVVGLFNEASNNTCSNTSGDAEARSDGNAGIRTGRIASLPVAAPGNACG